MMKYPIGIQEFEKIRNESYVYVDKTAMIYELADTGCYYFLSRPRRFGKSLLISTMEAYFSGKKELFQGLALEQLEQKWVKHPILHLDLNTEKYETPEDLEKRLNRALVEWEGIYGAEPSETSLSMRFMGVVKRAAKQTGERVVILVDEYDKPLLQAIGNEALMDAYRNTLKSFYSVMKTQDKYIQFGFLTGVTKFSKVSIFSDLNNLQDISMIEEYTDICGISEAELHQYFGESVKALAAKNKLTEAACYERLRKKFDGYNFEYGTESIYNPFSLLNTFKYMKFQSYWFETGTPTFLVKVLRNTDYTLPNLQTHEVPSDLLNSIDNVTSSPIPVLYQSGYLTIKGYDEEFQLYRVGFPNEEVEQGFIRYLLPIYAPVEKDEGETYVSHFVRDVRNGKPEAFLERLQTMFEDNDYRVAGKMEVYFQNTMYVIFKMMGFFTQVERATAKGRIDITIQTKDYIYIIEIKLDGSAEQALQQIEAKGYAKPFAQDPRKLYKIGINFSSKTRSIEEWKIEG